ncbi:MAG: hypothetical protein J5693_05640 [Bacteroidales bacterium]|nr:hypothetical protein [Bacteroidales bacterium]
MKNFKLFCTVALLAAFTALVAGCGKVNMKQFKQPKETVKIITTTSFRPSAENPAECGEPYDDNDLYPNKTEYLDSYGNPMLETWNHPAGEPYIYARYYYSNRTYGQLEKVVKYQPPMKPQTARFTRDETGAVIGVSETLVLPDKFFEKKEIERPTLKEEKTVTETKETVEEKTPLEENQVQIDYKTTRTDSVVELGTKVYDQNTGKLTQHSGIEYDKAEVVYAFGKTYEYTPDGKVKRIVNRDNTGTGFYTWEYDDHGNWVDYKYWKEPDDGKAYSQSKAYEYNENGEWTRCVTTTNGEVEAIVLRTFEYLDK